MIGVLIKPDDNIEPVEVGPDWQDIVTILGGYMEVIQRGPIEMLHGTVMLVDEDGQMKRLPANAVASLLAGRVIVGPALLLNADRTEFVSIPDPDAAVLQLQRLAKAL